MLCYTLFMKAVILLIMSLLLPVPALAEPSIFFQTEKHDFGMVVQGEQPEFNFEFTNAGGDELIITNIDTS